MEKKMCKMIEQLREKENIIKDMQRRVVESDVCEKPKH